MTVQYTQRGGYHKPDFLHFNWHLEWQGMSDLLDEGIHGYVEVDLTGPGDITLVMTDGASSDVRHSFLKLNGTPPDPLNLIVPTEEDSWWILNSSGQPVTVKTAAGTGIELFDGIVAKLYCDGTDVLQIIQGTPGALSDISMLITDKGFKYVFETLDLGLWEQFQVDALNTVVTIEDDNNPAGHYSAYGGKFLRALAIAGYHWKKPLPFNPDVLYKISGRVRQKLDPSSGTQDIYIGVLGLAADGVTYVNNAGANSKTPSTQFFYAAYQEVLSTSSDWTYFEGYFKGTDVAPTVGTSPHPERPGKLHTDVRYIQPAFVLNDDNNNGQVDLDSIELELVPPISALSQLEETQVLSGNISLGINDIQRQLLDANGANRTVTLDDTFLKFHQHEGIYIENNGSVDVGLDQLEIKSNDGVTIGWLLPGFWILLKPTQDAPTGTDHWKAIDWSRERQLLEEDGDFYPLPRVLEYIATSIGGGGSGGGAQWASGNSYGGGGGSGRYAQLRFRVTDPSAVFAVTVGVGGAQTAAAAVNGNPGTGGTLTVEARTHSIGSGGGGGGMGTAALGTGGTGFVQGNNATSGRSGNGADGWDMLGEGGAGRTTDGAGQPGTGTGGAGGGGGADEGADGEAGGAGGDGRVYLQGV